MLLESDNSFLLSSSSSSSFQSVPRPNNAKASSITATISNANNKSMNSSEEEEGNIQLCASIQNASTKGSSQSQHRMIHVLVSNAGHFNFLHNVLLSMQHATAHDVNWTPLVLLGIGPGVCPLLYNTTTLTKKVICVPYLHRLLHQLARDEPESIVQIEKENAVQNHNGNITKIYESIDTTFYGWGAIEHKFLINAKLYAIRDVLYCGYDVFVTDTDVAFRKDPRPYFTTHTSTSSAAATNSNEKMIQVYAQNDTNPTSYPLDINSGFMYWKYSSSNLQLIQDIITIPPFWHIDQSRVNFMLEHHSTPHQLLSTLHFPNGQMFLHHKDILNMSNIVVFHANYNSKQDEKEHMLREMELWFLD